MNTSKHVKLVVLLMFLKKCELIASLANYSTPKNNPTLLRHYTHNLSDRDRSNVYHKFGYLLKPLRISNSLIGIQY